jgi:hypothetical protein
MAKEYFDSYGDVYDAYESISDVPFKTIHGEYITIIDYIVTVGSVNIRVNKYLGVFLQDDLVGIDRPAF